MLNSEIDPDEPAHDIKKQVVIPLPPPLYDLRTPKRSTLEGLNLLEGWRSQKDVKVVVKANKKPTTSEHWSQPGKTILVEYVHETSRHVAGWVAVTPDQADPLPPTWVLAKGFESLLAVDSKGKRTLKNVLFNHKRIWAGQCAKCDKYTLGTSQYFMRKGKCVNCAPKDLPVTANGTKGHNLFIAGNNPLGNTLHLISADNKAEAEQVAFAHGHAWVAPMYASRRGRTINLPTSPEPADRPDDCWPFALGDTPLGFTQATKTWQGDDGREWAWFKQPASPEVLERRAQADTAISNLVDFDDFM